MRQCTNHAAVVVLCLWTGVAFSQDAVTLKTRFATLFRTATTGTYAKIVWFKLRDNMKKPDTDICDILAMDTKDGVIRTLVAQGSNKLYSGASITWDGRRVIYGNQQDLTIHRINWDGTGDTVILRNFEGEGHCWQSSDGKQWVMSTEFKGDGVNGARLFRINIDNPSERVHLLTCASWSRVSWLGSTSWASTSLDGKYVVAGFPNYGSLGWFEVKATVGSNYTRLNPNGCYPTMSRDNRYQILHTDDGSLAHKQLYIQDIHGTRVLAKSLAGTTILPNSTDGFETLRWTSDPDYCTFWSGWYQGGQCDGRGTSNPKIVRISDLAWAGIHDNCTSAEGNCDVWFYTEGASQTVLDRATVVASGPRQRARALGRIYDLRGREMTTTVWSAGVSVAGPQRGAARIMGPGR